MRFDLQEPFFIFRRNSENNRFPSRYGIEINMEVLLTVNKDKIEAEALAWCTERNCNNSKVDWQFTASDARIKLKRLYPIID